MSILPAEIVVLVLSFLPPGDLESVRTILNFSSLSTSSRALAASQAVWKPQLSRWSWHHRSVVPSLEAVRLRLHADRLARECLLDFVVSKGSKRASYISALSSLGRGAQQQVERLVEEATEESEPERWLAIKAWGREALRVLWREEALKTWIRESQIKLRPKVRDVPGMASMIGEIKELRAKHDAEGADNLQHVLSMTVATKVVPDYVSSAAALAAYQRQDPEVVRERLLSLNPLELALRPLNDQMNATQIVAELWAAMDVNGFRPRDDKFENNWLTHLLFDAHPPTSPPAPGQKPALTTHAIMLILLTLIHNLPDSFGLHAWIFDNKFLALVIFDSRRGQARLFDPEKGGFLPEVPKKFRQRMEMPATARQFTFQMVRQISHYVAEHPNIPLELAATTYATPLVGAMFAEILLSTYKVAPASSDPRAPDTPQTLEMVATAFQSVAGFEQDNNATIVETPGSTTPAPVVSTPPPQEDQDSSASAPAAGIASSATSDGVHSSIPPLASATTLPAPPPSAAPPPPAPNAETPNPRTNADGSQPRLPGRNPKLLLEIYANFASALPWDSAMLNRVLKDGIGSSGEFVKDLEEDGPFRIPQEFVDSKWERVGTMFRLSRVPGGNLVGVILGLVSMSDGAKVYMCLSSDGTQFLIDHETLRARFEVLEDEDEIRMLLERQGDTLGLYFGAREGKSRLKLGARLKQMYLYPAEEEAGSAV